MPTPSLCQVMGGWDCPCSKALASFSMTILASLFGFSAALHGTTSNAIIAHRGESGPITLFWDIDGSDAIVTPPGVRRNSSVNIYGFNGVYPRINPDNSTVNGGVPQAGNLSLHLAAYATDLVRKIPDPHFKGKRFSWTESLKFSTSSHINQVPACWTLSSGARTGTPLHPNTEPYHSNWPKVMSPRPSQHTNVGHARSCSQPSTQRKHSDQTAVWVGA